MGYTDNNNILSYAIIHNPSPKLRQPVPDNGKAMVVAKPTTPVNSPGAASVLFAEFRHIVPDQALR